MGIGRAKARGSSRRAAPLSSTDGACSRQEPHKHTINHCVQQLPAHFDCFIFLLSSSVHVHTFNLAYVRIAHPPCTHSLAPSYLSYKRPYPRPEKPIQSINRSINRGAASPPRAAASWPSSPPGCAAIPPGLLRSGSTYIEDEWMDRSTREGHHTPQIGSHMYAPSSCCPRPPACRRRASCARFRSRDSRSTKCASCRRSRSSSAGVRWDGGGWMEGWVWCSVVWCVVV